MTGGTGYTEVEDNATDYRQKLQGIDLGNSSCLNVSLGSLFTFYFPI